MPTMTELRQALEANICETRDGLGVSEVPLCSLSKNISSSTSSTPTIQGCEQGKAGYQANRTVCSSSRVQRRASRAGVGRHPEDMNRRHRSTASKSTDRVQLKLEAVHAEHINVISNNALLGQSQVQALGHNQFLHASATPIARDGIG